MHVMHGLPLKMWKRSIQPTIMVTCWHFCCVFLVMKTSFLYDHFHEKQPDSDGDYFRMTLRHYHCMPYCMCTVDIHDSFMKSARVSSSFVLRVWGREDKSGCGHFCTNANFRCVNKSGGGLEFLVFRSQKAAGAAYSVSQLRMPMLWRWRWRRTVPTSDTDSGTRIDYALIGLYITYYCRSHSHFTWISLLCCREWCRVPWLYIFNLIK